MRIAGIAVTLVGVGLATLELYAGIWLMLVQGMVLIGEQFKGDAPVDSLTILGGIVRVLFCWIPIIAGIYTGAACFGVGAALAKAEPTKPNWRLG